MQVDPADKKNVTTADTLMDLLRNSFPPNIFQVTFTLIEWLTVLTSDWSTFQATLQQYKTVIVYPGELNVNRE